MRRSSEKRSQGRFDADPQIVSAHRRAIRLWLYGVAVLVVLMVMVGGATRLTDSGLSIVEWRPVTGALPPFREQAWMVEFDKYKTSSEYELVNKGMTLNQFKRIYWWEWGHRLLGRVIGAAFLLPLLFFQLRGWVEPGLKGRLWFVFALGALQGAIGWWMVASGLVGRVDVAQERLAIHLTTACVILVAVIWTARSIAPANVPWHQVAGIPFDRFLSADQLHMNDWSYGCIAKLLASSIADSAGRSTLISRGE
jgi:cytochrome c oxidase assembly protein subunit 15